MHRPGVKIIPIHGKVLHIHDTAFIAPGCTIIGDVTIGAESSVWYNCVLRADVSRIEIGERTNIQDGTVIHLASDQGTRVGDYVTVGHKALLHV